MTTLFGESGSRLDRLTGAAGRWSSTLAALAVPPRCVACGRGTLPQTRLCDYCRSALERLPNGTVAAGTRAHFNDCFTAFPYEGPVREIVRALKYRGAVAAAREMAALLVERVPVGLLSGAVLVPAPAHPARRRERGFNQTALLAQEIAAVCELPVLDCLERVGSRAPQATLSRAQRLELPRHAVRVKHGSLAVGARVVSPDFPTKVVLLDDVTTTGVTLEVCASAIRERYPIGSSLTMPVPGTALHHSVGHLEIGALTFASTSAHPAHQLDSRQVGNLKRG